MGYIEEKLVDGEQVVFRTKLHAAVLVFPIIALAVTVTVFGFAGVGLLVTLVAACWLAVELANHGISEFGVTNKRFLMKRGYLPRRFVDASWEEVEEIQVSQSTLAKKIGYGTVVVRKTDGSSASFSSLNQPLAFRDRAQDLMGRTKRTGHRPAK